MAVIIPIDLSTPNDGLGDPLRDGGVSINANFESLNVLKLETGGYVGTAQDLADGLATLPSTYVYKTGNINENINGIKTFLSPIVGELNGRVLPVLITSIGGSTASDGAGTWTKLADISINVDKNDATFVFELVSAYGYGLQNSSCIFMISMYRDILNNLTIQNKILSLTGDALGYDSILLGRDNSENIELWVQKKLNDFQFEMFELGRSATNRANVDITYLRDNGWQSGEPSFAQGATFSSLQVQYNQFSGWAEYRDTVYTTGSPFTVVDGASAVSLPNNAGAGVTTQTPTDIPTFYDGTVIPGRNGDGINITIEFKCRPAGAGANPRLTVSIDIGGAVGEFFTRDFFLNKGSGVEHNYLSSFDAYQLDTWQANGGTIKISATNEDIEIYDIRYVLTRTHKAR